MADKTYDLICFDFWLTLVTDYQRDRGMQRHTARVIAFQQALGWSAERRSDISEAMVAEWQHFDRVHKREHRTLTNRERVERLCAGLNAVVPRETALDTLLLALDDSLFAGPPVLIDGVKTLIEELSTRAQLAVISDTSYSTGASLRRLLEQYDLLQYFGPLTFSDEVGHAKPHPRPFEATLAAAAVPAERAVHIGDREWSDVAGAKTAGMDAILFLEAVPAGKRDKKQITAADWVADTTDELRKILTC